MAKYVLKLYAVQTFGGQITADQEPQAVVILCNSVEEKKEMKERAKRHLLWDSHARYYASEKDANKAISWALSN